MEQSTRKLRELRAELKPIYGDHTDAVIAMVGLDHHPSVLKALKARDLNEAEAVEQIHMNRKIECEAYCPLRHKSKFTRLVKTPSWLFKPLKPIPRKKPNITLKVQKGKYPEADIHVLVGGRKIGEARILSGKIYRGRDLGLGIFCLQQHTRKLTANEAREVEGWKHAFIEAIEQEARTRGEKRLRFSTGRHHNRFSVSKVPIHPEILETYGRLPLQHGYHLEIEQGTKEPVWVKELS